MDAQPAYTQERYVPRATGGRNGEWAIYDRKEQRFVRDEENIDVHEKWPVH